MRTALAVFVFIAGGAALMSFAAILERGQARRREERELRRAAQRWGKP